MRAQRSDSLSLDEFFATVRRIHSATPEIAEQICSGYEQGFKGELGPGEKSGRFWIAHRHGSEARSRGAHGTSTKGVA